MVGLVKVAKNNSEPETKSKQRFVLKDVGKYVQCTYNTY